MLASSINTEILILQIFILTAFILAPRMTNHFFLKNSKLYSKVHLVVLVFLLTGVMLDFQYSVLVWPLFCIFGFFLFLKQEQKKILSITGIASCIPFVFSLISSLWYVCGSLDLKLLGYNTSWSFYAALHGAFLGWLFVGCLTHLSKQNKSQNYFTLGCYLIFIFFLCIAFGINGVPYIKALGVIGLSILMPFYIGLFIINLEKGKKSSLLFAVLSVSAIALSMTLAVLNEFWLGTPKTVFGLPFMVLTHGLLNTFVAVPCFYFAIFTNQISHHSNG